MLFLLTFFLAIFVAWSSKCKWFDWLRRSNFMSSHVAYRINYTFFILCVEIFQHVIISFSFNFEKFRRELTWVKISKFRYRLIFTFRMIESYRISIFNRFENVRVRIIQILTIRSTHVVNNTIDEKTQKNWNLHEYQTNFSIESQS